MLECLESMKPVWKNSKSSQKVLNNSIARVSLPLNSRPIEKGREMKFKLEKFNPKRAKKTKFCLLLVFTTYIVKMKSKNFASEIRKPLVEKFVFLLILM